MVMISLFKIHTQVLDVSDNHLEVVPKSVFALAHLETLALRNNQLTFFPEEMALPRLVVLEAGNNALRTLPRLFIQCRALQSLHLEGNPIEPSVWELAAQLPKLLNFTHG